MPGACVCLSRELHPVFSVRPEAGHAAELILPHYKVSTGGALSKPGAYRADTFYGVVLRF